MAKIILTHEVSGLGAAGDIVEVKNGYARNYLLPRGFAIVWTQGGEKQVDSIKAARAARAVANLEEAQALAASLKSQPVKVTVKAGSNAACSAPRRPQTLLLLLNAGLGKIDSATLVSDHINRLATTPQTFAFTRTSLQTCAAGCCCCKSKSSDLLCA